MKLIQCDKGHYYDKEKFEFCPYCDIARGAGAATVPFGYDMKEETESGREGSAREIKRASEASCITGVEEPEQFAAAQLRRIPQEPENTWKARRDDNRTASYYSKAPEKSPVVGWLVAVEGAYYGEAFELKTGRNFVGRSPEMDIQLSLDMSVSGKKHAIIVYEPKAKIYIAQPGESNELFYLNDEVVLNNVMLKAYDILSIGETKFLFVPLCGEKFSWEEWKKNNREDK